MFYIFTGLQKDIQTLLKGQQEMAASLSDLDNALTTLTSTVATVQTDVNQLVKDFQALQAQLAAGVDYTNELTAVQNAITSLQGDVSTMTAADPAA
jgi:predicted  nucleic acid-binding Zn-ribbon protein